MRKLLIALTALMIVGCGTKEDPSQLFPRAYSCIDGFLYAHVDHGAVPVFDEADRLPKRCPNG